MHTTIQDPEISRSRSHLQFHQTTLMTTQCNNNNNNLSVRAAMTNNDLCLSFVGRHSQLGSSRHHTCDASALRRRQGECCWRLQTSRGLRYRVCADVLCAATVLPGSLVVILLAGRHIAAGPTSHEPYPWLKYVLAALGCLLLLLYLAWLATAVCVYRKAMRRRRRYGADGDDEDNDDIDIDSYVYPAAEDCSSVIEARRVSAATCTAGDSRRGVSCLSVHQSDNSGCSGGGDVTPPVHIPILLTPPSEEAPPPSQQQPQRQPQSPPPASGDDHQRRRGSRQ